MKILPQILAIALVATLAAGCGRHSGQGADKGAAASRPTVAAVAVKPGAAGAGAIEKAAGMTEESETTDVVAGLSPIAAAVAAATPAVSTPIPAKWVEGKNYTTLVPAQPTDAGADKVEVLEVFWYGCGHCFHLDPSIENWRQKGKAADVEFSRVPVMWNDTTRAHARLFYTIAALGKLEQLHAVVFREIHLKSNFLVAQDPAETERLQRAFLKANGVSDADFDKTYRSFSVESKLQRAELMTRRFKVTGVPLVVVNGKYTTDVGMAGGEPQLLSVIDDLAASERKH